jgi:hypothetical protein
MENYYLKTITVPIPEDKLVVIRKGERVEYEIDRIYSPEEQNTRVKRKVIGKVDPVQPGRMLPNEFYFELFPDNEVPEEVRDEFLRECEIRRQMRVIRKNPEEVAEGVVRGLGVMKSELGTSGTVFLVQHSSNEKGRPLVPQEGGMSYTMLRRVFDEIYYAVEELAGKYPNEVIVPFKVERINEVLEVLRNCVEDERIKPFLRLIEEGITYSDVLLMMKWYKVLPR